MNTKEQLERLYKLQEDIRTLQNSGLWERLDKAKWDIIRLSQKLEKEAEKKKLG